MNKELKVGRKGVMGLSGGKAVLQRYLPRRQAFSGVEFQAMAGGGDRGNHGTWRLHPVGGVIRAHVPDKPRRDESRYRCNPFPRC